MACARQQLEELLKLPRDERSKIAEALLESLEAESDAPSTHAWAAEIMKRIARNAPGVPAERVFTEGRKRLANK